MATFRQKSQKRSALLYIPAPFPDIGAFTTLVQSIIMKNPFGCTSYMTGRKNHPPVEKIREMYTANAMAHRRKAKHTPDADLYSVTLQCHDPDDTL